MDTTGEVKGRSLEDLAAEVARLRGRVNELYARFEAVAPSTDQVHPPNPEPLVTADDAVADTLPVEEGLWAWMGRNAVLPRVAAACFMLVVALILRTITDSGGVSPAVGTVLGLGYVVLLIFFGWRLYASGHTLAPVFTGCGFLLLFSIIAESRSHFSILPAWLGSLFLVGATAVAIHISILHRSRPLLWSAVMGGIMAGFILDFPDTVFPAAATILLVGLLGGMRAAAIKLSRGVRWPVIFAIVFLFFIWGFKLDFAVGRARVDPALFPLLPKIFSAWFMPFVLVFSFFFWGVAGRRLLRDIPLGTFGHILPLVGAVIMVMAGRVAVVEWWQRPGAMGWMAAVCAFVLMAMVLLKHKRSGGQGGVAGFASMAVAASVLLFASLPWLLGGISFSLVFWPVIFIAFLFFSRYLGSGNIRFLAVLIAFVIMAGGVFSGGYGGWVGGGAVSLVALVVETVTGLFAYAWCRENPPPENGFFKYIDKRDYVALGFLVSGMVSFFFLASMGLDRVFAPMGVRADFVDCGRTIIINTGAAALIVWGVIIRKDPGVALVGIVVALIGGAKVFFVDFFGASGVPLVMSVTSFGALAALCSVLLGNWQNMYSAASRVDG